ncbi:hypothetical protein EC890511_4796, partial [Escherichia coli 89.0511]
MLWRINFKY